MTDPQAPTGTNNEYVREQEQEEPCTTPLPTMAIKKVKNVVQKGMQHQPYLMLGLALGTGYVLAAGIPPKLLSYALRSGLKTGLSALAGHYLECVVRDMQCCTLPEEAIR